MVTKVLLQRRGRYHNLRFVILVFQCDKRKIVVIFTLHSKCFQALIERAFISQVIFLMLVNWLRFVLLGRSQVECAIHYVSRCRFYGVLNQLILAMFYG